MAIKKKTASKAKKAATGKPAKKAPVKKVTSKKPAPKKAPKKAVKKTAKKSTAAPAGKKVAAKKTGAIPKKAVSKSSAKPVKSSAARPSAKKTVVKKTAGIQKPVVKKGPASVKATTAKSKVTVKVQTPAKPQVPVKSKAPVKPPVVAKPKAAVKAPPVAKSKVEIKPTVTPVAAPTQAPAPLQAEKVVTQRYSEKELIEFRNLINHKLVEAREELTNLQSQIISANENGTDDTGASFKMLEDGSEALAKEEAANLAARQKKFIEQLEAALVRIENKTYGICRITGKLIPKERLRAVPHTTQSMEAKLKQYKD